MWLKKVSRCFAYLAFIFVLLFSSLTLAHADSEQIFVFGHKNPDVDAVVGALAASNLLNNTGYKSIPVILSVINPETEFVLNKFGIAVPENVTSVAGKTVALVDFNEESQGPSDIKDANIIFIADHHRLGGLTTAAPIEIWMQPLGSVNTLLYEIHTLKNVDIPKNLSGAMLCAILSDTLVFTSPTTTARDKFAAEILSKISGINDIEALGKDLMKIKSDVSRVSAEELVNRDYKDYVMNGKKVGIGQIEVMGLDEVEKRKAEFFAIIEKIRIDNGYHSVYLMLTDIMNHGTKILISSSDPSTITKAFGKQPEGNEIWLEGVVSRKSQVVPKLEKAFE